MFGKISLPYKTFMSAVISWKNYLIYSGKELTRLKREETKTESRYP